MFWSRPICPGHGDRVHDQSIILEFDVSRGGSRRNVPGTFLGTKSINESSLIKLHCVHKTYQKFCEENIHARLTGTSIWPRRATNEHLTHVIVYVDLLTF